MALGILSCLLLSFLNSLCFNFLPCFKYMVFGILSSELHYFFIFLSFICVVLGTLSCLLLCFPISLCFNYMVFESCNVCCIASIFHFASFLYGIEGLVILAALLSYFASLICMVLGILSCLLPCFLILLCFNYMVFGILLSLLHSSYISLCFICMALRISQCLLLCFLFHLYGIESLVIFVALLLHLTLLHLSVIEDIIIFVALFPNLTFAASLWYWGPCHIFE